MKRIIVIAFFLPLLLLACKENEGVDSERTNLDLTENEDQEKPKFETVEFESLDSLKITANLYEIDAAKPIIVLCHQAKFNKYEYAGVAERFNELGFNCLAIDQRSGGPIADQQNETWLRAVASGKPVTYLDAEQDIIAAINYAHNKYNQEVILLGSSYSSTLCVYQAIENEKVKAVIAFSPGNYFAPERGDLIEKMIAFEKPFFLTAAKNELPYVRELVLGRKRTENQIVFTPEGEGMHGARILWKDQEGGKEYWLAVEDFLKNLNTKTAIEQ